MGTARAARVGWGGMGLYDRFSTWMDHLLERQFHLHDFLERHFHAFGLHGPYTRHLAKTRVIPLLLLGTTLLIVLCATLLVRRWRARRRRRRLAAVVPATMLSAAGGRPPSR